jgi:hypothetical protein
MVRKLLWPMLAALIAGALMAGLAVGGNGAVSQPGVIRYRRVVTRSKIHRHIDLQADALERRRRRVRVRRVHSVRRAVVAIRSRMA